MKKGINKLIFFNVLFLLINSCSIKWTEAIRFGRVPTNEFKDSVSIEISNGLIFLPVNIKGKAYRFLFDSGAPFSISKKLQNDYKFKIISEGNIVDSAHNKKKVNWVQVDSIAIGDISFFQQSAFIGDFELNPVLKCLNIDGIIGSNIIRHCNWTIDQESNILSVYSEIDEQDLINDIIIPFKTDHQYNIYIDLNIGETTIKNLLVDYGSNGSVSLNKDIFNKLKNDNHFTNIYLEIGIVQSGIIGKQVDLRREMTVTDLVNIDNVYLKNTMLQTGKTTSIGNNLLSQFNITIDSKNKNFYLSKNNKPINSNILPGFKLGFSPSKGVYVQSVIKNSNVYKKGVRPEMKIVKMDSLDLKNANNFCNCINYKLDDKFHLQLLDSLGRKKDYLVRKTFF